MKLNLSNELDLDWSLPWKIRFAHGTDAEKMYSLQYHVVIHLCF